MGGSWPRYERGAPRRGVVGGALADFPTCQLSGFSICRFVGKLAGAGRRVAEVASWAVVYPGVRERGELQEVGRARVGSLGGGVMN